MTNLIEKLLQVYADNFSYLSGYLYIARRISCFYPITIDLSWNANCNVKSSKHRFTYLTPLMLFTHIVCSILRTRSNIFVLLFFPFCTARIKATKFYDVRNCEQITHRRRVSHEPDIRTILSIQLQMRLKLTGNLHPQSMTRIQSKNTHEFRDTSLSTLKFTLYFEIFNGEKIRWFKEY